MTATTPVTPARVRYLHDRALERARCDEALERGFAIDPSFSEAASHELLVRSVLPFRRPRLTDRIIPIDATFTAAHAHLEPVDRWEAAAATRAATGLRSHHRL